MAFADHVDADGRALWWGVDVCTAGDDFATVQYRWATSAADVGSNHYQERIVSLGNIQRALGQDHLPVASTVELVLDNTDFAVDWLVTRTTVASALFKARFRLWVGVGDGTANVYQETLATQQIGIFACLDYPERNAATVRLALADDAVAKLQDVLVAPTMADWRADSGTTTSNSVFSSATAPVAWGTAFGTNPELRPLLDFSTPLPIQLGSSPYSAALAYTWRDVPAPADFDTGAWGSSQRPYLLPLVVCATRDSAALTSDDVTQLRGTFAADVEQQILPGVLPVAGTTVRIPETFYSSASRATVRIWKAYKTQTITKNGYDWKLLWLAFNGRTYEQWWGETHTWVDGASNVTRPAQPPLGSVGPTETLPGQGVVTGLVHHLYGRYVAAFENFLVSGRPGSGVFAKTLDTYRNPVNLLRDLVESYSSMGAGGVDTTRFTRAQGKRQAFDCKGEIVSGGAAGYTGAAGERLSSEIGPYGLGQLRKAIADLAASADLDVFVSMEGKVACVTQGADFETQTTTYPTVAEERTSNVSDRTPSLGQRWAPFNRSFLRAHDGKLLGPFDDRAAITAWGRIISRMPLESKWWWHPVVNGKVADQLMITEAFRLRATESVVRPVISFTTDVGVLTLDLGDYFLMSWTRGGESAVYSLALWKLEAVTISPEKGSVSVVAVWMDDLQTTQPFLLDDESYFVRVAAAGGRTCTVTDGSDTATFSSGSLITDGVAAGDMLRLRDTTEVATAFTRNRDVRITDVSDATTLRLSSADLDFGSAGAHVVAEWSIVRGQSTYPDEVSDPTNYPNGSDMYGKISDADGLFADASAANQLLDG